MRRINRYGKTVFKYCPVWLPAQRMIFSGGPSVTIFPPNAPRSERVAEAT